MSDHVGPQERHTADEGVARGTRQALIERYLPVAELGAEARRENSTGQHPPPNRLHVWWARRPLIVSRAAVLAGLLPPDISREEFLKTLGIRGDPVAARKAIARAKQTGERLNDPYGYGRAFTYNPDGERLRSLLDRILEYWDTDRIAMLDPMAGGGSIPLEAMRYGLETYANELNPVAYVILKATLEYPAKFGEGLAEDIRKWAGQVGERARGRLEKFYPKGEREDVFCYMWARTVRCPECGLTVPLSPNWWLARGDVAVRVVPPEKGSACSFELVTGREFRGYEPSDGTISRGTARCPRCRGTIDGDYVKAEAQAGRMGDQLYALGIQTPAGKSFRLPADQDAEGVQRAEEDLKRRIGRWEAEGLVPSEPIPPGHKTDEALRYGFQSWRDIFSPRQLLAQMTYLELLREAKAELLRALPRDRAEAVVTYLALLFDKCCDYNSRLTHWDGTRNKIANTFDRHDFSFKWSYGEMNLIFPGLGYDWATDQILDAYRGIAGLAAPAQTLFERDGGRSVRVTVGDAATWHSAPDKSVHLICVDPPYYDNVMYGELSDFFYVWEKRLLGDIYPEAFGGQLVEKEAEAVANPARFRSLKGARKLAEQDYESKMQRCFERMRTLLRDDGLVTVMFTHKKVQAWDTLAAALLNAGFEVTASWPVHTESEHSLHQAQKNAAASTILIVCRKRRAAGGAVWWEDLLPEVRRVARAKAAEFEELGIGGVDLYISTFGPALGVISKHWPVRNRHGEVIRPDVALDEARAEVTNYRFEHLLVKHSANLPIDGPTRWTIMAWDIYQAAQFPYDEARKLAIAVGDVDLERHVKARGIARKSGQYIVLEEPAKRERRRAVDPTADQFDFLIDAIHTACLVFQHDGARACRRFLERTGLLTDAVFEATVEAFVHAVPPAVGHPSMPPPKRRGEWYVREIAQTFLGGRVALPDYEQMEIPFAGEEEEEAGEEPGEG